MSLKTELEQSIKNHIEEVNRYAIGSEEHEEAVNALTKMLDRYNEMCKNEDEFMLKDMEVRQKETELEIKNKQVENEHKRGKWANIITAGGTVLGAGVTIWGALKTWKYEETGIIGSGPGRKFMDMLFKKR